jgi:hypothetical protein
MADPSEDELPYRQETSTEFNRLAAEKMRGQTNPPDGEPVEIVVQTECPRCGHATSDVAPLAMIYSGHRSATDDRPTAGRGAGSRHLTMRCECAVVHGEGKVGCGAYWAVVVRWSP